MTDRVTKMFEAAVARDAQAKIDREDYEHWCEVLAGAEEDYKAAMEDVRATHAAYLKACARENEEAGRVMTHRARVEMMEREK